MSQQLKDLLKEIMKTKDPELIEMATEMLKESSRDDTAPVATKPAPQDSNKEDFLTSIKKEKIEGETVGVPVNEMPRENKFIDEGTEHKDEQNMTPEIERTERRRPPFKKIAQTCTRCGTDVETHPQFKRDFYVCDKCLKR